MTNRSRPVKFHPGELVKWTIHRDPRVHLVDHNSGADTCWIANRAWNQPIPVRECELRRLTFAEFAWFRHPSTGRMMSGKTRGYMAVIIHLFTLLIVGGWWEQDGGWWSLCPLVIVIGYWIGTYFNYTGKWK